MTTASRFSGACGYGAQVVLERIAPLLREVEGVRRNEDPECLHRMRVASRRLRSALLLLEGCVPPETLRSWRRAMRRLTRVLGEARDLDVQLLFLEDFLGKSGTDASLSEEDGAASDATAKLRKDIQEALPPEMLAGVERLAGTFRDDPGTRIERSRDGEAFVSLGVEEKDPVVPIGAPGSQEPDADSLPVLFVPGVEEKTLHQVAEIRVSREEGAVSQTLRPPLEEFSCLEIRDGGEGKRHLLAVVEGMMVVVDFRGDDDASREDEKEGENDP